MKLLPFILLALLSHFVPEHDIVMGDLLIRNINVINIKTGKVDRSVDIVVTKDRISRIASHSSSIRYQVS